MKGRGRDPIAPKQEEYLRSLESVGSGIRDPVVKLRFIRTSLYRYAEAHPTVRAVPFALACHAPV